MKESALQLGKLSWKLEFFISFDAGTLRLHKPFRNAISNAIWPAVPLQLHKLFRKKSYGSAVR